MTEFAQVDYKMLLSDYGKGPATSHPSLPQPTSLDPPLITTHVGRVYRRTPWVTSANTRVDKFRQVRVPGQVQSGYSR